MAKEGQSSSCERPAGTVRKRGNRNRHYPFRDDFTWKGVTVQRYKSGHDDWSEVARQVLIGASGETARFHLRYFEIKPGGYSSYETHKHEHVVIGIRGSGRAQVSKRSIPIRFLDVLYIKANTPHRLYNPHKKPFGFFCIVNARRDKPKPVKR